MSLRDALEEAVKEARPDDLPALAGVLAEAQARLQIRLTPTNGNGFTPEPEPEGRLLTYREAATWLHCSTSYVETLVRQNKLPHVCLGRLVRLRASDLRAWAEKHRC